MELRIRISKTLLAVRSKTDKHLKSKYFNKTKSNTSNFMKIKTEYLFLSSIKQAVAMNLILILFEETDDKNLSLWLSSFDF